MFRTILLLILVSFATGFAQEATGFAQEANQVETNYQKTQKYAPTFYLLKTMDKNVEEEDYNVVKKIITDVEEIYLTRLIKFMDSAGKEIDSQLKIRKNDYEFELFIGYFDEVVSLTAENQHLLRALGLIEEAHGRFNMIKEAVIARKAEVDITEVEYKLNKLGGILYMFRGDPYNLKKAIPYFEYILSPDGGEPLTSDKKELIEIHNYLGGICHRLYVKNKGDVVISTYYLRKELYYLWKLVDLETEEGSLLREYKRKHLARTYYSAINVEGKNYFDLYQPYVDEITDNILKKDSR